MKAHLEAALVAASLSLSFGAVALAARQGHLAIALVTAASCSAMLTASLVRKRTRAGRTILALRLREERLGALVSERERFIAHAAHEIRAPLTVLYGQLALALRRPRGEHEYRIAMEEALDAAVDLRALTEGLLDLARAGASSAGAFEPTSIARVARRATRCVHGDAERSSVALEVRVEDAIVAGRAADLERLLQNLLENAVRHSPPGGRVRVEAAARGGAVEIAVEDDGGGVTELDRPRLFEPFFRGAGAAGSRGAGLGLAIVREIALTHGGTVRLDTIAPRGARFVVRLPLWRPKEARIASPAPTPQAIPEPVALRLHPS